MIFLIIIFDLGEWMFVDSFAELTCKEKENKKFRYDAIGKFCSDFITYFFLKFFCFSSFCSIVILSN